MHSQNYNKSEHSYATDTAYNILYVRYVSSFVFNDNISVEYEVLPIEFFPCTVSLTKTFRMKLDCTMIMMSFSLQQYVTEYK